MAKKEAKYLAIGFNEAEKTTASVKVNTTDAQTVANRLTVHMGQCPDQIMLVGNGEGSPNVMFHMNIDDDYQEPTKKYHIQYVADGELYSVGPFDTERQALDCVIKERDAEDGEGEFDIRFQNVYILYPNGQGKKLSEEDL